MKLSEARAIAQTRFVKPAIDKVFAAGVYSSGAELPQEVESLSGKTPVLVSEPVHWDIEFRFFVRERRVMSFSSYWRNDHSTRREDGTWEAGSEEVEEAQHFIDVVLADVSVKIPPAIVIDVGKIADCGWAVIEANAAWAAGIYGCDPLQVLSVLERACIHRDELSIESASWECNRDAKRMR